MTSRNGKNRTLRRSKDIRVKENAPEFDYSSCDDWHANTGCLVARDLALLTKVRTLIHEEISLLTGVSPTKVRKVPQDSCQLPWSKGF